jgi:hypothetical protein
MLMKLALALKAAEAVAGQAEGMEVAGQAEGMEVAGQAEGMEEEDREDIRLPLHLILLKIHKIYS